MSKQVILNQKCDRCEYVESETVNPPRKKGEVKVEPRRAWFFVTIEPLTGAGDVMVAEICGRCASEVAADIPSATYSVVR